MIVLVKAWLAGDRPEYHIRLGSFERWSSVVGGIIQAAGGGIGMLPAKDEGELIAAVERSPAVQGGAGRILLVDDTATVLMSVKLMLLAQGYGFSDEAKRVPVKADADLFRIGSITKMFTWVSVMQLVEQGKLVLNAGITTYIKDFQIARVPHLMGFTVEGRPVRARRLGEQRRLRVPVCATSTMTFASFIRLINAIPASLSPPSTRSVTPLAY